MEMLGKYCSSDELLGFTDGVFSFPQLARLTITSNNNAIVDNSQRRCFIVVKNKVCQY